MLGTILLIVLLLMLLGAIPAWPHSRSWGYYRAADWRDPADPDHPAALGPHLGPITE